MVFSRLSKKLITAILGTSIFFSTQNLQAQEYEIKQDYIINKEGFVIRDKKTLYQILKTEQIQKEINSLNIKELELLYFYALGQEFTIKNTDYIELSLTLPAKLLAKYLIGEEISLGGILDEFKELKKEKEEETSEEVKNDPEKHMKSLAYHYFSESRKRFKENLTIMKKEPLTYEDALKFKENSIYINTYITPAQKFYFDILNTRPLEERWAIEFIEAVKEALPEKATKITDKILEEILEGIDKELEEYAPLQTFKNSVKENRKNINNKQQENENLVENRVRGFLNYRINNEIVFISDKDGDFDIYSMDKEGKNVIKLTDNRVDDLYPQFFNNQIIYTSKENGNWDIWIMNSDGSNKKQLTNDHSNEGYGRISSDGKYLFFTSNRNGNYDIYKQSLSSGEIEQLTNTPEEERFLEISQNSKWVAYEVNYRDKPVEICITNGKLTRDFGYGYNPNWMGDDISYSTGYEIKVKSVYGYEKFTLDKLTNKNTFLVYPCCWVNENQLLYRLDTRDSTDLYIYDRLEKKTKRLTNKHWNDQADYLK